MKTTHETDNAPAVPRCEAWGYVDHRGCAIKFKNARHRSELANAIECGGLEYLYTSPAEKLGNDIQSALESLVERCNNDAGMSSEDAVIHAESVLERVYNSRSTTPAPAPAQEPDDGDVTGTYGLLPEHGWDGVPKDLPVKPRMQINVRIDVPPDWAIRGDMQTIVEREVKAERWAWFHVESSPAQEPANETFQSRYEREFMERMAGNHGKLTEFCAALESFTHDYQRLYSTYKSYRDMISDLIKERDSLRDQVAKPAQEVGLTDEHPMQPIVKANDGVIRFKKNQIVSDLYDLAAKHGLDMNELACRKYPREDRSQFAQLIGYSVSGWGDLSYAMNIDQADAIAALRAKGGK